MTPKWLPDLICLDSFDGNWTRYLEKLYEIFVRDFLKGTAYFQKQKVVQKKYSEYDGKSATFWHLIQEGPEESERTPSLDRCARIAWPRAIIDAVGSDQVKFWANKRQGKSRWVIALNDFSYIVVLGQRKNYLILLTAYPVEKDHRRNKLAKEYECYKKASAASN